jgi:hypothetical protein
MVELLLDVVREGQDQGSISTEISDFALALYFDAFMDLFTDARIQIGLSSNPGLVRDLTTLMIGGLR